MIRLPKPFAASQQSALSIGYEHRFNGKLRISRRLDRTYVGRIDKRNYQLLDRHEKGACDDTGKTSGSPERSAYSGI